MEVLRITIEVRDDSTGDPRGSAKLIVTPAQQQLIGMVTDTKDLARWAAEELGSIITCLEEMSK